MAPQWFGLRRERGLIERIIPSFRDWPRVDPDAVVARVDTAHA
jgi:hypothetical protein